MINTKALLGSPRVGAFSRALLLNAVVLFRLGCGLNSDSACEIYEFVRNNAVTDSPKGGLGHFFIVCTSQAGSEFTPQRSQNDAKFSSNPRDKAQRLEVIQSGIVIDQ